MTTAKNDTNGSVRSHKILKKKIVMFFILSPLFNQCFSDRAIALNFLLFCLRFIDIIVKNNMKARNV